ncbi:unnamed protein product [Dibothriocephalus latus]|uniref:Uncharacterized protein n=1 Tax=Dibothriocephalus latus TaxID=60516 RepID=A0A3P7L3X0_DIBLA|nr:unnamed protein product [Dibothriocephalus latus]
MADLAGLVRCSSTHGDPWQQTWTFRTIIFAIIGDGIPKVQEPLPCPDGLTLEDAYGPDAILLSPQRSACTVHLYGMIFYRDANAGLCARKMNGNLRSLTTVICGKVQAFPASGAQNPKADSLHHDHFDFCCLSEVRIPDSAGREINTLGFNSHFKFYHKRPGDSSGAAIALLVRANRELLAWESFNDHTAYSRLKGHFTNTFVVFVYAHKSVAEQRHNKTFYRV